MPSASQISEYQPIILHMRIYWWNVPAAKYLSPNTFLYEYFYCWLYICCALFKIACWNPWPGFILHKFIGLRLQHQTGSGGHELPITSKGWNSSKATHIVSVDRLGTEWAYDQPSIEYWTVYNGRNGSVHLNSFKQTYNHLQMFSFPWRDQHLLLERNSDGKRSWLSCNRLDLW